MSDCKTKISSDKFLSAQVSKNMDNGNGNEVDHGIKYNFNENDTKTHMDCRNLVEKAPRLSAKQKTHCRDAKHPTQSPINRHKLEK
jgi:hypothetical protein